MVTDEINELLSKNKDLKESLEKKFPLKSKISIIPTLGWLQLFGHLHNFCEDTFHEKNFPLYNGEQKVEVELYGFDHIISGYDALQELSKQGKNLAGLWACGKYIKEYPEVQEKYILVAIGVRYNGYTPVFSYGLGKPDVLLCSLEYPFSPDRCRFLLADK